MSSRDFRALLMNLVPRLVNWLLRVRSPEALMMKIGGAILVTCLGASFVAEGTFFDQSFRLSMGESTPLLIQWCAIALGGIPLMVGLVITVMKTITQHRRENRSRVLMIEIRGLKNGADAPLQSADLPGIGSNREELLFDLRQGIRDGDILNPDAALQKLSLLPATLQSKLAGRDRRDISVVIGGVASVPYLALAGMYLDDEAPATIADWKRPTHWRLLDAPEDDGQALQVSGVDHLAEGSREVVLAISVSYRIQADTLDRSFADMPRVEAALPEPRLDAHWSAARQERLRLQFRDLVVALANRGVERIHLALAVPAALAIAMGMSYDRRNWPLGIVYQFEPSPTPHYLWGIALPARSGEARVVFTEKNTGAVSAHA